MRCGTSVAGWIAWWLLRSRCRSDVCAEASHWRPGPESQDGVASDRPDGSGAGDTSSAARRTSVIASSASRSRMRPDGAAAAPAPARRAARSGSWSRPCVGAHDRRVLGSRRGQLTGRLPEGAVARRCLLAGALVPARRRPTCGWPRLPGRRVSFSVVVDALADAVDGCGRARRARVRRCRAVLRVVSAVLVDTSELRGFERRGSSAFVVEGRPRGVIQLRKLRWPAASG